MGTSLFLIGYFAGVSVFVAGGVLLAISPKKFRSIQHSLMRVNPEARHYLYSESGWEIRIVGVIAALVGIGMIVGPVSAMLSGGKPLAVSQHAVITPHFSLGLLLGYSAFVIIGLFTAAKPKSAWQFFTRKRLPEEREEPRLRRAMVYVRLFGAVFSVLGMYGIWAVLASR